MKTYIFYLSLAFFILISLPSFSQTERGAKLLGGGGRIHLTGNYFSAGLEPNVGIFVRDNFVVGASLPLSFSRDTRSHHIISQQAGFTPFIRYYFGEGSTRLFALASFGYEHNWWQHKTATFENYSSSGYAIGSAGIGLVHFLTEQIGVEARATYSGFKQNEIYDAAVNLSFGFQIYLPSSR